MAHGGFHIPDATPLSEGYGVGGIQAFGTAGGVSRLLHRRVLCMLDAMRLGLISSISLSLSLSPVSFSSGRRAMSHFGGPATVTAIC